MELFKLHLCLYIGFSSILGHVAAGGSFSVKSLMVGGLIFVLACGSAVLNNIQDKEFDRYFKRTQTRSLPAGKMPVVTAAVIAGLMIVSGLSGMWLVGGGSLVFLGILSVISYNGLYTPLKKRTLLAIIPGAWCGMLVPMMGWTAADGSFKDPVIWVIMVVFGLWQMAHFFIIILKTRDRMIYQVKLPVFPSFLKFFSNREIRLQIMIWTSLYTLAMLLFLQQGVIGSAIFSITLFVNAFVNWLLLFWVVFMKKLSITTAFVGINLSILFFMGIGICDKIV